MRLSIFASHVNDVQVWLMLFSFHLFNGTGNRERYICTSLIFAGFPYTYTILIRKRSSVIRVRRLICLSKNSRSVVGHLVPPGGIWSAFLLQPRGLNTQRGPKVLRALVKNASVSHSFLIWYNIFHDKFYWQQLEWKCESSDIFIWISEYSVCPCFALMTECLCVCLRDQADMDSTSVYKSFRSVWD